MTIGFLNAVETYTEDFFLNNRLVLVLLEEGSGSIRHRVENIEKNGDIIIRRLLPGWGTDDMAEWHIIIELSNRIQPEQFQAIMVDEMVP